MARKFGETVDEKKESENSETSEGEKAKPTTTTTTNKTPSVATTNPTNSPTVAGSSSTTTSPNVQSVSKIHSSVYTNRASYNSLTEGAGVVSDVASSNVQQSQQETGQANAEKMGVNPKYVYQAGQISYNTSQSFDPNSNLFYAYQGKQIDPNSAQGMQIASILAQQRARNSLLPATNSQNTFLQNESASLTNAEQRQKKFVDSNLFQANATPTASAPIPDIIYTSTNLYEQAGARDNPLSILEGNPFIAPQQQFMPQINDEFAPRPAYEAMTKNPYIGVHQNSPLSPNSDAGESQRMGVKDWLSDIGLNFSYKYVIPIGIIVIVFLLYLWKGRRN